MFISYNIKIPLAPQQYIIYALMKCIELYATNLIPSVNMII